MKRRDFLTKTVSAGIIAGIGLNLGKSESILASEKSSFAASEFDLVAVMGGEPDIMFDKAIASMGGMGKFVKKGQKVVVKPNIGWDKSPEYAATTNPILVKRIVEQ